MEIILQNRPVRKIVAARQSRETKIEEADAARCGFALRFVQVLGGGLRL